MCLPIVLLTQINFFTIISSISKFLDKLGAPHKLSVGKQEKVMTVHTSEVYLSDFWSLQKMWKQERDSLKEERFVLGHDFTCFVHGRLAPLLWVCAEAEHGASGRPIESNEKGSGPRCILQRHTLSNHFHQPHLPQSCHLLMVHSSSG